MLLYCFVLYTINLFCHFILLHIRTLNLIHKSHFHYQYFFSRAVLKTIKMCVALDGPVTLAKYTSSHFPTLLFTGTFLLSSLQGSIKKKIESFRRWSSASMKRPPKPKTKTLSLSSPVGDPEDLWLQEGDRRKLRPIVDSVFGQVCYVISLTCIRLCLQIMDRCSE